MKVRAYLKQITWLRCIVMAGRLVKNCLRQRINLYKTLRVNFSLLPFSQAVRLPILVFNKVKILSLTGKATIQGEIHTGMIIIGINDDYFSAPRGAALICIKGEIIFGGSVVFNIDNSIEVWQNATLYIGDGSYIGNAVKIRCSESITIGECVMIATENQLFDTNFHYVRDIHTGAMARQSAPITLGAFSWIGNRSSIMKGTKIPPYTIVASNSLLNRDYTAIVPETSLIGGVPAKMIKTGVIRVHDMACTESADNYFRENPSQQIYTAQTGIWNEKKDVVDYNKSILYKR